MKVTRRFIALLASALVFFSVVTVFQADSTDDSVPVRYVNFADVSVELDVSGLRANCLCSVSTKSSFYLTTKMELQKKSGSSYSTVKTWTKAATGTYLSDSQSCFINPLADYRLKVTFTAGSETVIRYVY